MKMSKARLARYKQETNVKKKERGKPKQTCNKPFTGRDSEWRCAVNMAEEGKKWQNVVKGSSNLARNLRQ